MVNFDNKKTPQVILWRFFLCHLRTIYFLIERLGHNQIVSFS